MNIDLRDENIVDLCFDASGVTPEESKVANSVTVMHAERNHIQRLGGLNVVFAHLTELHLSHNNLGEATSPVHVVTRVGEHGMDASMPLCEGIAPWILALPATLTTLDISYNHLNSFAACSCTLGRNGYSTDGLSTHLTEDGLTGDKEEQMARYLRHTCPLSLGLFFPAAKFPHLRSLNASHNTLTASVRETDVMEDIWQRVTEHCSMSWQCAASQVNLSFNVGLSSFNGSLLATTTDVRHGVQPCPLRQLDVSESGLDDLAGISAAAYYASCLSHMTLRPSPLSSSILLASPEVLGDLLETLLLSFLTRENLGMAATPSLWETLSPEQKAFRRALKTLAHDHMADLESELAPKWRFTPSSVSNVMYPVLHHCVYVLMIKEVALSVDSLDGESIPVALCSEALVGAAQSVLLAQSRPRTEESSPHDAHSSGLPPRPTTRNSPSLTSSGGDTFRRQNSLSALASSVAPRLRSRVLVEDPITDHSDSGMAACTSGGERYKTAVAALQPVTREREGSNCFPTPMPMCVSEASIDKMEVIAEASCRSDMDYLTPARFSSEEGSVYEAMCSESRRLEEVLLNTQERKRDAASVIAQLKVQLTNDRGLVKDQRRELARLRTIRDELRKSTDAKLSRIEKRKKEILYGVTALHTREASEREKQALHRIALKERELQRKEKFLQRRLAQTAALSVEYHHDGPPKPCRKLRSEVLREAAVRERMEERAAKDPFSYSPHRFRAELASPARSVSKQAKGPITKRTVPYFKGYTEGQHNDVSVPQHTALRTASDAKDKSLLPRNSSPLPEAAVIPRSVALGNGDHSVRQHSSPSAVKKLVQMGGPKVNGTLNTRDVVDFGQVAGKDLSELSLEELFEASASIRRKQIALQDAHQRRMWQQEKAIRSSYLSRGLECCEEVVEGDSTMSGHGVLDASCCAGMQTCDSPEVDVVSNRPRDNHEPASFLYPTPITTAAEENASVRGHLSHPTWDSVDTQGDRVSACKVLPSDLPSAISGDASIAEGDPVSICRTLF